MVRVLTKFFPSKAISSFLKRHDKKNVFDIIDLIMEFDIDVLVDFIAVGNFNCDMDAAYDLLDNYIQADESRSYMSAAMDLLCEFDMDKHALSSLGVPAQKIKERMDKAIEGISEKFDDKLNSLADSAINAAEESNTQDSDKEESDNQDSTSDVPFQVL